MSFSEIKSVIQLITVLISISLHSILIVLIITKSPKKMGTYRHLMCFFSFFSMIYALDDYTVQPYIHSHGASFSMIMDLRKSILPHQYAFFFVASLAGCFGVTIYAIAINFIYRCFALERKGRLRYFNKTYLIIWFIIPILGGLAWVFLCWLTMYPDPEFTEYLRTSIMERYGLDASFITYTGSCFFRYDKNGNWHWSIENTIGAAGLNAIMSVPFLIICIFGYKSKLLIGKLKEQGDSEYTKKLQTQLYKALIAQTFIPMVFLFFPIGILFISPLLHLNIENGSEIVTLFYSLYPAVDPIPIILFIDDYRNALFAVFKRNSVGPMDNRQVSVISNEITFK